MHRKVIIQYKKAPGDIVVFSGMIRDLKLTYGKDIDIDVRVSWPQVFENNPHLTPLHTKRDNAATYVIGSNEPGIRLAGRGHQMHFLTDFHRQIQEITGLRVPTIFPKPDIHLSEFEKTTRPISGRYWVMFAGGKTDMTTKLWRHSWYQTVVNELREQGVKIVQSGAIRSGKTQHIHPPLTNVLNLVGWGELREMFWQIYHSEGVIGPITCGMHVAAAFDKPCVVIAGGREEPWWEHYGYGGNFGRSAGPVQVPHRFLHTIGKLPCCESNGCWISKVIQTQGEKRFCHRPVVTPNAQTMPECMEMIKPSDVVSAVLSYYSDGTLPPIKPDADPLAFTVAGQALTIPPIEPRMQVALPMKAAMPMLFPITKKTGSKMDLLDSPVIGGKMTICTLLYGDYHDLHKKCIDSIVSTVPEDRRDLRIGCNQVPDKTLAYLDNVPMTKRYVHEDNALKYPVMREMFWDPTAPIETKYLCWFDDDTYAVRPNWLSLLAETIIQNPDVGIFGDVMGHQLKMTADHDPRTWFKEADWYKGKDFRNRSGGAAPNGDYIRFCVGWFWCMKTEAMIASNVPDQRLRHNGGDLTISEQLWQNGYSMKQFNTAKSIIYTIPKGNRRGYSERFPFYKA